MSEELNIEKQPIIVPQEEVKVLAEEVVKEAVVAEEIVKEIQAEKPTPVAVAPAAPKPVEVKEEVKSNEVKVERIVQHLPSGYRLLLEDGQIVKVGKKDFKQGQKTITLK